MYVWHENRKEAGVVVKVGGERQPAVGGQGDGRGRWGSAATK